MPGGGVGVRFGLIGELSSLLNPRLTNRGEAGILPDVLGDDLATST